MLGIYISGHPLEKAKSANRKTNKYKHTGIKTIRRADAQQLVMTEEL